MLGDGVVEISDNVVSGMFSEFFSILVGDGVSVRKIWIFENFSSQYLLNSLELIEKISMLSTPQ